MRIHYLQHVPFEGLGSMQPYFESLDGVKIRCTHLYNNESLPAHEEYDWLIIMGGPMSVHDEAIFPWLRAEKLFIKSAIDAGKMVLGICLGAQLIAVTQSASVTKNPEKEIGWFPLKAGAQTKDSALNKIFASDILAFHWHGETFELPEGANHLASSLACPNQAFSIDDRVIGFQFHLETTPECAEALITNCADDMTNGKYVQSMNAILSEPHHFEQANQIMREILSVLYEKAKLMKSP